jgi:hypothetical protein
MASIRLTTVFRGLIIVQLVAMAAIVWMSAVTPSHHTDYDGLRLAVAGVTALMIFLSMGAWLISCAGLLFFKPWARKLYTIALPAFWLLAVAVSLYVDLHDPQNALDETMSGIVDFTGGAVLVLMWATDVKNCFATQNQRQPARVRGAP